MNKKLIRTALAQRDWRQYQLARKLNVSDSYLSLIVRGLRRPPKTVADKMERLLGLQGGALEHD